MWLREHIDVSKMIGTLGKGSIGLEQTTYMFCAFGQVNQPLCASVSPL